MSCRCVLTERGRVKIVPLGTFKDVLNVCCTQASRINGSLFYSIFFWDFPFFHLSCRDNFLRASEPNLKSKQTRAKPEQEKLSQNLQKDLVIIYLSGYG